jgi:hypothetical protein
MKRSELKQIIKEELENLKESNKFTKNQYKDIYDTISNAMGEKLPIKVFKGGNPADINLPDGTSIIFNTNKGIVIIQNLGGKIKNYKKIGNALKKLFGDVEIRSDYINARDYGSSYKEKIDIKKPNNPKSIIKINPNDIKTVGDAKKVLKTIGDIINSRKMSIKLKNKKLKYTIISGDNIFKIIKLKYDNNLYVLNGFDLFYIKNKQEGEQLLNLMRLENKIYREIEVKSWDMEK